MSGQPFKQKWPPRIAMIILPLKPLNVGVDGPSVHPERRYCYWLFKDFTYRPEIWEDGAQFHEADHYLGWPCSADIWVSHNFQISHERLGSGLRDDVAAFFKDFRYRPEI